MPTLKEHARRHHRVRMAVAKGDWDEFNRIIDETITEAERKPESTTGASGAGVDPPNNEGQR